MRVVVTGGGTAGHVTPLLAVASELKRQHPRAEIRYIGNYGDNFGSLADNAGAIHGSWRIMAGKFRRYHGVSKFIYIKDLRIMLRNFRDFFYFIIGFLQSLWLLIWWRPNVLFVKGGFVGLPVGLAAALLRIPIVTHDSDTVPGLTNRILSRFARYMAVAMPPEYYSYPKNRIRYTGLPIGAEFIAVTPELQIESRNKLGIPEDAFVVAVFGGSLGAVRLNNAVIAVANNYLQQDTSRWLLHQTGSFQQKEIAFFYDSLDDSVKSRVKMWPYVEEMHIVTAAADVIISRAGSTIHQLSAQRKAVILVPNPVLTGGHQTINAKVLADRGAAIIITERELSDTKNERLLDVLAMLAADSKQRQALATALSGLAVPDAAANIVRVLEEVAG